MKFPRLYEKLFCEPLMLHGPVRQSFETQLLARINGEAQAVPVAIVNAPAAQQPDSWRLERIYQTAGPVAVITIDGVIDKRISAFEMDCYGGVDLSDVDEALAFAANDPAITTVVLDIHSPGGSVVGVHETYSRIADLAQTKEVHSYINRMACSAGYYLAAPADVIAAAPSAIVGSIGVYIALLDASQAYENEGLKVNAIQGGKLKTMGADWKPLSKEERNIFQERVDALFAQFRGAVSAFRDVEESTMEGQWFDAAKGHELGLVDVLTGATLDEYVSGLIAA